MVSRQIGIERLRRRALCWRSGETFETCLETCSATMDLRRIIPTDITVSAIVHLSLLALLLLFSEVHQFGSVTAEPIEVNIVAPQDIPETPAPEKQPEPVPTPTPLPDFSLLDT